jgi:sugar lactone lactonase YvrE
MVVSHKLSRSAVAGTACLVVLVALTLQGCGNSRSSSLFPIRLITNLFVPDAGNNRVLIYNQPFITGQGANVVLGQTALDSGTSGATATTMSTPAGVALDKSGNLYVADFSNCRVLQFKPSFVNGMPAMVALGQPDLTTGGCTPGGPGPLASASNLNGPAGVASDSGGNLWVADSAYSRVVQYTEPFSTGKSASLAVGQADLTSGGICPSLTTPTASSLCNPSGVAVDSHGNLWVADTNSHRVLQFVPPFSTNMSATLELGQPSGAAFTSGTANNGGISASTLDNPAALTFDVSGNLWVADESNNRVLEFKPPFANGMAATTVLGQGDFTSSSPNQGMSGPTAATLSNPQGLQVDSSGGLFVGDSANNRTLRFASPFSNGMNATIVIGQSDFTSSAANQGGSNPSATSQSSPFSAGPSFIALAVLAMLIGIWYFVRRKRSKNVLAA